MKTTAPALSFTALLLGTAALAQTPAPVTTPAAPAQSAPAVQTPATPAPATPAPVTPPTVTWDQTSLSRASYAIQEPVWQGSTSLVSAEQRSGILQALKNDAAGALKRRYPAATIVAADAPGAVKVTPVLTAPQALVPWAKLGLSLNLQLPGGPTQTLTESFGLLTLWQQGPEAANYAYDQMVKKLP